MVDAVEADAGQAAKESKATDEEGKAPLQPVGAVQKQRQPTPDHPPYCWMIAEAIDELCQDGGLEEDSISAFIRTRYPGVPPAHDRLLRHYLNKHVAEGFFVCTAAGRYLRSPVENTVVERPVEPAAVGSSEQVGLGSPVAEVRCGRRWPRKDGSSSTSSAGKKDGARSVTPKRRGQHRAAAGLAADEGSVPTSSVALADKKDEGCIPTSPGAMADKKDGSQAASSTPKRFIVRLKIRRKEDQ